MRKTGQDGNSRSGKILTEGEEGRTLGVRAVGKEKVRGLVAE